MKNIAFKIKVASQNTIYGTLFLSDVVWEGYEIKRTRCDV